MTQDNNTVAEVVLHSPSSSSSEVRIDFSNAQAEQLAARIIALYPSARAFRKEFRKIFHGNLELRTDSKDDIGRVTCIKPIEIHQTPRSTIATYQQESYPAFQFPCDIDHNDIVEVKQSLFRVQPDVVFVLESSTYGDDTTCNHAYARVVRPCAKSMNAAKEIIETVGSIF